MALMGKPGEAAELGSVCATQVLLGQGIMSVFHESANMISSNRVHSCPKAGPKGLPKIEIYLS